ncbi:MAG: glutamine synthetase [Clostridia bacterium]|nr:glutamine synthetase [Clostridia bacterium]
MISTFHEVLEFVDENDVQFIRLGFCDPCGIQKNISVMPEELERAFRDGVSFDASAIRGFGGGARSDLLLFPDPATLTVLPWRPGPGRVVRFYCDVRTPDGQPFARDGRFLLKKVMERFDRLGYGCRVGSECEFYLFQTGEDGEPTGVTMDRGGYLDIAPLDKGENIRRELCLSLAEMGIAPECSHHEQGPGQNEIDFRPGDPLACADNLLTFKSAVKAIAARNGLYASFLPKPLPGAPGSGLHINLSLSKNGVNLFRSEEDLRGGAFGSFLAGILAFAPELSLFLNPLVNSYERLGVFEAPRYVSWSPQNRSQLVRIPAAHGEKMRMELRSPDPAANPYLAFALILAAGLEGLEQGLGLPAAVDEDLYRAPAQITAALAQLPQTMEEAIKLAEGSTLVHSVLGEEFLNAYLAMKRAEFSELTAAADQERFFREHYFLQF